MFSGSTITQLWQAAAAQGYGPEGHTSIYAFLENLSTDDGRGE
jgi:3-hydroxyisobutyrate dehydrogenase-like beta-hydroxyacid dehydrogenase